MADDKWNQTAPWNEEYMEIMERIAHALEDILELMEERV